MGLQADSQDRHGVCPLSPSAPTPGARLELKDRTERKGIAADVRVESVLEEFFKRLKHSEDLRREIRWGTKDRRAQGAKRFASLRKGGALTDWTKVITNPLGLAGFSLFLIFGFIGRLKLSQKRPWIVIVAFAMSAVSLLGGLLLAYSKASTEKTAQSPTAPADNQTCSQVEQSSTGNASPNVNCVKGPVTITIDQSSGSPKTTSNAPSAPSEKPRSTK